MKRVLSNRWLSIVVRIALGVIFVYSAWPKLSDPPGFAHAIWNYRILPPSGINLTALTLPWLELFAGVALISGLFRRGSAVIVAALLAVFISALALNIARGNPVDCGCFSVAAVGKSQAELLRGMKFDVFRDIGLLLMSLQAMFTPATWGKVSRP